jgi:hypothetical protein
MIIIQQLERKSPGLDTTKIDSDEAETGTAYGCEHMSTKRINHCPNQIIGRQLDSRDVIVMPNSQVAESQLPQGSFGALNLAQLGWSHEMVVRNSRCETGCCRFIGHRQIQRSRHRTHRPLRHADVGEGSQHVMISCGAGTWPIGSSGIVSVLPVRDGIQPVTLDHLVLDATEQFVLAVEATIRTVRLILRTIIFMGFHLDDQNPDVASDLMRCAPLLGRETWRDAQQCYDPLDPKSPRGESKQQ